ncbi:MAG TPA: hypothetical protein VJ872_00270 [Nocardioides sp.]|nr:hypothetical protein [Nocardioides sp.]
MAQEIAPDLAVRAIANERLDVIGRTGLDISTIATWDPELSRRTRILVPVDVQAYVATAGGEATVGVRGVDDDPAPFADGTAREPGVHLHWALPDALMGATHEQGGTQPVMSELPDQWVVVRTLMPTGRRQVIATAWAVDARTRVVTPLASYAGAATVDPEDPNLIAPLTAGRVGIMPIAVYDAVVGRFGFHDPLDDLASLADQAPDGFAGDHATYTVCGWWSDESQDPLHDAFGPTGLDDALRDLGWHVTHDADDEDLAEPDDRSVQAQARAGLKQPVEKPAPRVYRSDGSTATGLLHGAAYQAAYPVEEMASVILGDAFPTYHALLHGSVLGVPVDGGLPGADDRPDPASLRVAIGADVDDVAAAFGTAGLGLTDEQRAVAEESLEAFVLGTTSLLGTPDGLDDLATREHDLGFWSLPGTDLVPPSPPDRLRVHDTLPTGPSDVGGPGRSARANRIDDLRAGPATRLGAKAMGRTGSGADVAGLTWKSTFDLRNADLEVRQTIADVLGRPVKPVDQSRSVARPAPRFHRPAPLLVALRGGHPSHRHHGDGLFDPQGLLCRYPHQAVPHWQGLVSGAAVLPTLGSGAIPPEVTTVVREAVLLDGYGASWLAAAGAPTSDLAAPYAVRLDAEMVRLYGTEGRYDGLTVLPGAAAPKGKGAKAAVSGWTEHQERTSPLNRRLTDAMAAFSVLDGLPPSPVALTTWRQPWVPLWLEWEVTLTGTDTLRGWHLEGYDLEPDAVGEPATITRTLSGRSPLGQGVGKKVSAAVDGRVRSEAQRAITNRQSPFSAQAVLAELGSLGAPLDLLSASLDGVREQLLGIGYIGQAPRDRATGKVVATGEAVPLFGGELRIERLRVVDAFGRTLEPDDAVLGGTVTTLDLEVPGDPRAVRLRPRLQGSARWLLRLVDAAQGREVPVGDLHEAYVDEIDPGAATNPVAGFLLPDHIDESLETFTVAGAPLGELGHDAVTGAVGWEPAPGRAVRADAGPFEGVADHDRLVAEIAAGLVRADAAARTRPEGPPADSALVNLLRVVDTTLWSVDTFATVGTASIAGLVGRPIAVVRATLRLDVPDDLEEVLVQTPADAVGRKAAFDAVGDELVEVRIGTLTNSSDAVLGYFVDDDYEHLHLVDEAVAAHARVSGRLVGQLGLLGPTGSLAQPGEEALVHPYLVTDGVLRVRPRQTTRLTLLMLPLGKVHVTSGLLPRKEIALADSWTAAGLTKLVPSVRVGPLLVDPAEIRLPLVNLLGDKQTFTRRTGELAWRDDPIVAASETAYLPRTPHEIQEGWIRVTPPDAQAQPGSGS